MATPTHIDNKEQQLIINYYVTISKYKNSYKEIVTFHVFVCKGGFFFLVNNLVYSISLFIKCLDRTYFAEIEN